MYIDVTFWENESNLIEDYPVQLAHSVYRVNCQNVKPAQSRGIVLFYHSRPMLWVKSLSRQWRTLICVPRRTPLRLSIANFSNRFFSITLSVKVSILAEFMLESVVLCNILRESNRTLTSGGVFVCGRPLQYLNVCLFMYPINALCDAIGVRSNKI